MSLERRKIRHAFRDYLKGNTIADERVYAQRRVNLAQENWAQTAENQPLPLIIVRTGNETPTVFSDTPRVYRRELEVFADGVLQRDTSEDTDVSDQLDHFAWQVECVLLPRLTLPDCADVEIDPAARLDEITTGESAGTRKPIAAFSMRFVVPYFFEVSEEELANVKSFRRLGVRWDVANPDRQIDAEDDFAPSGS